MLLDGYGAGCVVVVLRPDEYVGAEDAGGGALEVLDALDVPVDAGRIVML